MEIGLHDLEGKEIGKSEIPSLIFEKKPNMHLVHSALVSYLANQRGGTASTKSRGEVRGGGRKPWRQKGTGRARAGSIRSPLWRGGGVIFGPKPRSYRIDLPAKMKKAALGAVFADRANEGRIKVVEGLNLLQPKTKEAVKILKNFGLEKYKTLIIHDRLDEDLKRATSNLKNVEFVEGRNVNIYNLLWSDWILISRPALSRFCEVLVK